MAAHATEALVRRFFAAVEASDGAAIATLLAEEAVHDAASGQRSVGRETARDAIMTTLLSARESRGDVVVMTDAGGGRAAAEFTLRGKGAASVGVTIFEIEDGLIGRVSEFRRGG